MTETPSSVWLRTEPTVEGNSYIAVVEVDDDIARVLTPDDALRYAWGVLAAAHRASYDAAVVKQLHQKLGLELEVVGQMLHDLRNDRPDLDHEHTKPLRLEPGVNREFEPFLKLYLDGSEEPVGQWEIEDARQHALAALEITSVADLDGAYFRALTGLVGLEAGRARKVVEDIANFR